jgi:transcriptional regulator with XRE-family HTH domain
MERLKELRERKKLTQKQVSEKIEVDRTTYSKYESGASEPSFEILKKLARFYEVSTDFLLDFSIDKNEPVFVLSQDEEQIIIAYRDFNEKGREKLREELYIMSVSGIYKNNSDFSSVECG